MLTLFLPVGRLGWQEDYLATQNVQVVNFCLLYSFNIPKSDDIPLAFCRGNQRDSGGWQRFCKTHLEINLGIYSLILILSSLSRGSAWSSGQKWLQISSFLLSNLR